MRNLLEFLVRYYHWMLFVLLEVVSAILLFRNNIYHGSVWFSSANAVVGYVYEKGAEVAAFFSLVDINKQLTQRNFFLERKVNQLSRLYAEATADTTAAERIELDLLDKYKPIAAKVISNSLHSADNLITIDKGRSHGVDANMGVACGTGVVGVVCVASDHYSVIMPVINSRSRISCTIRNRGYFGYLTWQGGDTRIAYLEDIPRHATFEKGDWVETNGYSSIFPQGILVGKILDVSNSRDGLSYRMKIQLSTDFGKLRDVCVISDMELVESGRLMQIARDSLNNKN